MTLEEEIASLYASLKEPTNRAPLALIDELDYRCAWLARSSELLADAQLSHDRKMGDESEKLISRDLSPSIVGTILRGLCAEEKRTLTLAERLNSTLVHQIDAIRSILSYEKESMRNLQT